MRKHFLAVLAVTVTGCSTVLPVGMSQDVDPQTAPSCARACKAVGMQVAGIVFIRSMGGCVCEPVAATAPADPRGAAGPRAEAGRPGASAAQMGGAVLVALEEEAARQQQQNTSSVGGPPGAGHR